MATVAELLVKIGANSSGLKKELDATQRQMKRAFGPEALAMSGKAATMMDVLAGAIGATGVASVIMSGKMAASSKAFETLLGDTQKAKDFLSDLAKFAAETPFEFEGLQDTSKKLLAFKFAAEDIIPIMTAIGDAAGMLGSGQEGIDRMTLAIAQMQSKGKIQSQEMLQLAEAGVNAWQYLADSMGMSISQIMDKVGKGEVSAQTGINAIIIGMQKDFKGGMEKQSKEIPGLWSTVMDNTKMVLTSAGDDLVKALGIKEKLQGLADFLSDFAADVKSIGIGQALRDIIPPSLVPAILGVSGAIVGSAIPAIRSMTIELMKGLIPLALNPWVLALAGVGAAIGGVIYLVNEQRYATEKQIKSLRHQSEQLGSLISEYKELKSKTSLTVDEKKRFYDISNKIADIAPEVVSGYTKEGNAIINLNAALKTQVALKRQELQANQKKLNDEIKGTEKLIQKNEEWIRNQQNAEKFHIEEAQEYRKQMGQSTEISEEAAIAMKKVWFGADYQTQIRNHNKALLEAREKLKGLRDEYDEVNNLLAGKMVIRKEFTGLHNENNFGGDDKTYETIKKKAEQTSEAIQNEWVQTTKTKLEQLDIWKAEQLKSLDDSKGANENYQRDIERVGAVYTERRLKILADEQQKTNEIWDAAADSAKNYQEQLNGIGLKGVAKQKFDIETDAAGKIEDIQRKYRDLAATFSTSTEAQREEYKKAWEANGIQFEITSQGMVDFSNEIAKEQILIEKQKNQDIIDLHYERKDFEESLDEAYNEGQIQRYLELLNEKSALLAQNLSGQQAMMDTYYTIWQDSHRTAMDYMAEATNTMYSGLQDFFADIINNSKSVGDAWDSLKSKFLRMLGEMVAQWMASKIMMWAIDKLYGNKMQGQTTSQAASTAVAWAPAAAMASLASFGGNAAPAMMGIALTTGLAYGLAALPALAEGGITTGPTIAEIGEGRYKEAVMPLNKKYFEKVGLAGNNQPPVQSLTVNINSIDGKSTEQWLDNGGGAKIKKYFKNESSGFGI